MMARAVGVPLTLRLLRASRSATARWCAVLLAAWAALLLAGDVAVFHLALARCAAPPGDHSVALVADPQLTDAYSYGQRPGPALWLVERVSDVYMRRSFAALQVWRRPATVVFVGDLFDGGRHWGDEQWAGEYARFQRVFPRPPPQQQQQRFALGNHDAGISPWFVPGALARFERHFGAANAVWPLDAAGRFELVVVNAPSLTDDAHGVERDATVEFVNRYAAQRRVRTGPAPVPILVSHIPLFRPRGSPCGADRAGRRPLSQGYGFMYQNLLQKTESEWLLRSIEPAVVFSGDDHLPCQYEHAPFNVTEFTVGTFSWLQGNYAPSVGLVGLDTATGTVRYSNCFLPLQMATYAVYGSYFFVALVILCVLAAGESRRDAEDRRLKQGDERDVEPDGQRRQRSFSFGSGSPASKGPRVDVYLMVGATLTVGVGVFLVVLGGDLL